jgi:hypothetical protein
MSNPCHAQKSQLGHNEGAFIDGLSFEYKTIFMGRNRGQITENSDEHASSSALILDYSSTSYGKLTFTGQYITSWVNYDGGSRGTGLTPAESLNLSRFNLLNNAYLQYQFNSKSYLRVGRQTLNLQFARGYNIRHKAQAFEGAVFYSEGLTDWKITLGYLDKFSNWASRDFFNDSQENQFVDVERVLGGSDENTDANRGIQFIEASYEGIKGLSLSFYDYYGDDLYNSFGVHGDYVLHDQSWQYVLRFKYLSQQDVGSFTDKIDSQGLQFATQFLKDAFSLEVGILSIPGSETENNLRTPFQPNLIGEEPLFEVDLAFTADSISYYTESSYGWQDQSVYLLLLSTHAKQSDTDNFEVNLIYSFDITTSLNVKFKYAYYQQSIGSEAEDTWVSDYRMFFVYRF